MPEAGGGDFAWTIELWKSCDFSFASAAQAGAQARPTSPRDRPGACWRQVACEGEADSVELWDTLAAANGS